MKTATRIGNFVRTYFAIGAAICVLAIIQTQIQTQALLKIRTRYKWLILMAVFALNALAGLYLVLRRADTKGPWESLRLTGARRIAGIIAGTALLLLPVPLFLAARADFFGRGIEAFFRLLWLFWWIALLQAAGLRLAAGLDWPTALVAALLLDGVAAQVRTLGAAVSNYPFSIGWSEASRYYYGSLIFSKRLYGEVLPLSVMHGTRYLLQSLPFVVSGVTIWWARLWQVLLWIGLSLWSSWAIVRRLGIRERLSALLVVAWLFLFYFQGAVYYHLQVCVILIMYGVKLNRPWRSLAAILAASLWAGMSRVNWFPVPAMLAIMLYILERPFRDARDWRDYLKTPLLWGMLGLAAALGGQALYVALSGNSNLEAFASSFTSALLWYRWLPSPTNPIGIIPGVLIVSLPLWVLIAWRLREVPGRLHALRLLGLAGMLVILLAGGLVVSTKIGGGGDLHNMDAYLVMLASVGAYGLTDRARPEGARNSEGTSPPWAMVAWMALVPVAFSLLRLGNSFSYDVDRAGADLAALRQDVAHYAQGGEVLFMYERHLLAFGIIPGIPMVGDYEVVTLMEMAISGNKVYLDKYYRDLQTRRFAAIVAHPQNLGVETGDFIEENNAWSRLVAQPMLCQYKPALTLDYSKIQILVPRARPCAEFPPQVGAP